MPLKKSGGPVVGLDIGTSFIKACELEARGGRVTLRGIAVEPTPPDAVQNNEIVDPVALGRTIKQVLNRAGIRGKRVVTCVSGQSSLVVRIIEVPKMTRSELQETMKWEIERHVPFAAEQVVMDYQPLVPPEEVPEGQNMEILLAVAQEGLVTRHVEAIQAAGLQPVAIDIEPLAASRALIDLANGSGPAGTVAIVDVGASTTDISIYREGRIAFTRSIQLAGNNLTKAISDVLARPLAEAEELKHQHATIPEQAQQGGGGGGATDVFGQPFGELPTLDFGVPDAGGVPMGGTFGLGADPGASTATDTQSEPAFDIAGGGFSADAFASPAGDPAVSPFAPGAAPMFPGGTGPVPAGNPFDPEAAADSAVGPGAFDTSLFGAAPGADPFAPVDDPFAAPAPVAGLGPSGIPSTMSDEEYLKTQVADAIMPVLHELVTELRRSLDFYRNRANGLGAQTVIVTGGTSKLPGVAPFLSANLELPVLLGNPLEYVTAGPKADAGYLKDVGPVFPVSIGLAVRELLVDTAPARAPRKKR
jgi:type IV pilus assembly protein PilM